MGDGSSHKPLQTAVTFACTKGWAERPHVCQAGDKVEVKIIEKNLDAFPPVIVKTLRAIVAEVFASNASLRVSWLLQAHLDEVVDLPDVVPWTNAYHYGVSYDTEATAYIESMFEPQDCQTEVKVHVSSLCAHEQLAPPHAPEAEIIKCLAQDPPPSSSTEVGEAESGASSKTAVDTSST